MANTILGKRIAERRKKLNLLQSDLAQKLDTSKSSIAMWETGKRDPDSSMLSKLASFFNVTTDFLLGRTDDPTGTYFHEGSIGWLLNMSEERYLEHFKKHANNTLVQAVEGATKLKEIVKMLNGAFEKLQYDSLIHENYEDAKTDELIMHLELINGILSHAEDAQDIKFITEVIDLTKILNERGHKMVPMIYSIQAGKSLLSDSNIEEYIYYPFANKEQPDFCFQVEDDSMIEAGIENGDIVFLQRAKWAEFNGQIIAVVIEGQKEGNLKKIKWSEGSPKIKLISENHECEEIEVWPNEIKVCGIYMGHFRPYNKNIISLGIDIDSKL